MGTERGSLIRLMGVVLECSPITRICIHTLIPDFCRAFSAIRISIHNPCRQSPWNETCFWRRLFSEEKHQLFKAPFRRREWLLFVFRPLGPSLTITKALQTSDVCSDSSFTQSMQNYAIEVSFSYFEWHICLSIPEAGGIEANFDWLSRYACPVVHTVTPVRVWCMMKRSWLVGQLTTPTSIAHARFAALRFCLCSMWKSETWLTRKGNLVSNQISRHFCRDIHHFKQFSLVSTQIPLSRHTYLPDRHRRWTSTSLWCHWQSIQQWQKRPCKNAFLSLQFQCYGIIFCNHHFIMVLIVMYNTMHHVFQNISTDSSETCCNLYSRATYNVINIKLAKLFFLDPSMYVQKTNERNVHRPKTCTKRTFSAE